MKTHWLNLVLAMVLLVSLTGCTTRASRADEGPVFNPGHYVAVGPRFDLAEIRYLDDPAIRGVNKRYFWRDLEPEEGRYDFSEIRRDLEYVESMGKQLVVFVMDKSFSSKSALPPYMREYELSSDWGGYAPVRWHPEFIDRFTALGRALGKGFDGHPNFEGLAVQESSLGITDEGYGRFGYTPEKYRDALIEILTGLQGSLPNSHVFWYSNFLPDNEEYLYDVADGIEESGVFMGGPDILPFRRYLGRVSYPMYETCKDTLVLFCSAQGDSYRHHRNDIRVDEQEPVHEDGYLTMEEIFRFARDTLHVRYIFWEYYYEGVGRGERSFDDAIRVIRRHPRF